jgi:hypothetical protein
MYWHSGTTLVVRLPKLRQRFQIRSLRTVIAQTGKSPRVPGLCDPRVIVQAKNCPRSITGPLFVNKGKRLLGRFLQSE